MHRVIGAVLIGIAVFITAFVIWYDNRKNGSLDDEELIYDNLNRSLKSAFWNFVAYMFTFSTLILANYGASMIVSKHPAWGMPMGALIIIGSAAATTWLAILPALNVGFNFIVVLALQINLFVKHHYPLEYYASKPGKPECKKDGK